MIVKLPVELSIYDNSAYLNYSLEDAAFERKCNSLKIQRKSNSKRFDTLVQKWRN